MTRDDIFNIAKKAGLTHGRITPEGISIDISAVERFANLIVETEREAIATEFMERQKAVKHLNNYWHHAAIYVRERGQHD